MTVFYLFQVYRHFLKVYILYLQVCYRAEPVSGRNEVIDCRPIPPLRPPVGFRLFQEAFQFCVCIRLFDFLIHLHQFGMDGLHILPLGAERKEHPQPSYPRIQRTCFLARLQLTEYEIVKDLLRDFIHIPDAAFPVKIGQILFVVGDSARA